MAVMYGKFEMPSQIPAQGDQNFMRFVVEPFEKGYAHIVGNSMRRIALTSIEAPAIIAVRIEGVPHEYSAIEGVIEDMTNIILNLKGALLRRLPDTEIGQSRDSRIVTTSLEIGREDLDKNGGSVTVCLKDIMKSPLYELINPELPIFTVTKPFRRQIDLRIAIGRGYVPSERHQVRDKAIDEILIDACYSPVRLVNYFVENTRVGQDTDFDRLVLEVTTDGRISAKEAVSFASQIAVKHFEVFHKLKAPSISFDMEEGGEASDQDEMMEKLILRIDEIELSVRSTNCLSGANIETIAELVSIPERKMLEFRNFGKKSLNEIKAKLVEMGLHLGMDLSRYGITPDNVKDKVRHYQEEKSKKEKLEE